MHLEWFLFSSSFSFVDAHVQIMKYWLVQDTVCTLCQWDVGVFCVRNLGASIFLVHLEQHCSFSNAWCFRGTWNCSCIMHWFERTVLLGRVCLLASQRLNMSPLWCAFSKWPVRLGVWWLVSNPSLLHGSTPCCSYPIGPAKSSLLHQYIQMGKAAQNRFYYEAVPSNALVKGLLASVKGLLASWS